MTVEQKKSRQQSSYFPETKASLKKKYYGEESHVRYIQALLLLVELLHYCALISRELHSDATPALL